MQTVKFINSTHHNIQCECDRNLCVYEECPHTTHLKYLITSDYEDDSYWLCEDCRRYHFGDKFRMGLLTQRNKFDII